MAVVYTPAEIRKKLGNIDWNNFNARVNWRMEEYMLCLCTLPMCENRFAKWLESGRQFYGDNEEYRIFVERKKMSRLECQSIRRYLPKSVA